MKKIVLIIGILLLITSCNKDDILPVSIFEVRVKNSSMFELDNVTVTGGEFTTLEYGKLTPNLTSIYKTFDASYHKVRIEYNNETIFIGTQSFGATFSNGELVTINIFYSEEFGFQAEYSSLLSIN